jgi:starvation-inducible DNA-binding protein
MVTKTKKTNSTKSQKSSSIASRAIATPTDLTPTQVKKIVETMNPIIADTVALYIKVKNFHWHLASSHYRDYHILFDEHAEQLVTSLDPLAERVRRIGGATIRSIGHIQKLTGVEDDNDEFVSADDMIERLLADNLSIAKQLRKAIELTQDNRDHPTSDLLIGILDDTEKRIWFLHETIQGGENVK